MIGALFCYFFAYAKNNLRIWVSIYDFNFERIALDYTNYFSYISSSNDKSNLAKRGRNKQKRHDLRQYSLALITTKELGLPLYSHVYEGNKNDQTIFAEYTDVLKKRIPGYNPKNITLVFDGGNNTKTNLETLKNHYVCSFSLSCCKSLYDIDVAEYYDIEYNEKTTKGYRITKKIWGKERECILTFSHPLYVGQIKEFDENISSVIDSFNSLNEQLSNPKSRIDKKEGPIRDKIKSILSAKYMDEVFETKIAIREQDNLVSRVEYSLNESSKTCITHKYFGKKLIITALLSI